MGGVAGLGLQVLPSGGRSWVLRATVGDKRRDMGLGGYPDVMLAGAREAAREAREKIRAGIDPIEQKRAARSALSAAQGKAMTFKACAEAYIAANETGWKNAKHRQQWTSSLAADVYPIIGNLLVSDVALVHVLKVLEPIWLTKTETAKRLRGRIERVLDWATGRELRKGDNPARWKGSLKDQLAAPGKVAKVKHHAALPVPETAAFMRRLSVAEGQGVRCLEFAILTAARSGEARGARWPEIAGEVWTIPAERMKAGKEHRVALSPAAVKLLQGLPRMAGTDLVFSASRGGQLSDGTLGAVLKRMGQEDITVHGFRSTFRDWAGEMTAHPREVIEHALAHHLKDKAEASYARGTLFEKRKLLMADWAAFCAKTESATVIPMKKTVRA